MKLKQLIEKREVELNILLKEYNEEHKAKLRMSDNVSSTDASPDAKRIYEEKRLVSQDGTVEEVQLDLSLLKTLQGKTRGKKKSPQKQNFATSPFSRGSNVASSGRKTASVIGGRAISSSAAKKYQTDKRKNSQVKK